ATAQQLGLPERAIELQMLYGMGDAIKAALVQIGQRVRVYAPFGELLPGMGYLVRRLLENTSNDSFLRQSFVEHTAVDELLRSPEEERQHDVDVSADGHPPADGTFSNEPELDFAQEENRRRFQDALAAVRQQLGLSYPLVIDGKESFTGAELVSRNPSHPEEIVGRVARAGIPEAQQSMAAACRALPAWQATPA